MSTYVVAETVHRVYDSSEGLCFEVRPEPEFPDCVLLWTPNKESS